MGITIYGAGGEEQNFETKAQAGAYLRGEGFGQDATSGYDLRDFDDAELLDAVARSRSGVPYWSVVFSA